MLKTNMYGCAVPHCPNQADPSNGKGLCPSCDKIDCDDGMEQAREMCENMHEFGTIDKPNNDPLLKIVEAGYHCAHTNDELFAMMDAQGIERPSVETLDNLRGVYAQTVEPDKNTEGWCSTHKMWEAEGGPCAECERLAQLEVVKMDQAMKEQQYSLWVLCQKTHLFKVPVYNFNDAKTLYHSLNWRVVSGVRIARHCEVEGCEVVLHTFM